MTELLDVEPQSLRRLEFVLDQASARPSGNQRCYSRDDIESLAAAAQLAAEGFAPVAIERILVLQHRLDAEGTHEP